MTRSKTWKVMLVVLAVFWVLVFVGLGQIANASQPGDQVIEMQIESVDADAATVTLEDGSMFSIDPDDVVNFHAGDTVELTVNKSWGTSLTSEDGDQSFSTEE